MSNSVKRTVALIPSFSGSQDFNNENESFLVVDLHSAAFLGVAGPKLAADDEYGYDAVFGWETFTGGSSKNLFKSLDDAVNNLIDFAVENENENENESGE